MDREPSSTPRPPRRFSFPLHTCAMDLYVITGTTKGLGQALAARVASDANRFLVSISRAPEGPVAGGVLLSADLADVGEVTSACKRLEDAIRGKAFDKAVLINNAGVVS